MNSTIQHIGESGVSEEHNTTYRGKWTERGLGVTFVLYVWCVNIIMGKVIVEIHSKKECLSLLFIAALFGLVVTNKTGSVHIT